MNTINNTKNGRQSTYLICDDPFNGSETYIRKLGSFTMRISDSFVLEGTASPQDIEDARTYYAEYLLFINK